MMEEEREWLKDFPYLAPDKVVAQFFLLLGAAWEAKKGEFTADCWEDDITNELIDWMKKAIRADRPIKGIRWGGVYPQIDLFDEARDGKNKVIGRCDLTIVLAKNREYHYECKRLWAVGKKETFTKSARLYVNEGLYRFLRPSEKQIDCEAQYPSWLGFAGMLGYVMNGNVPKALDFVHTAISEHAPAQTLESPCEPPCPAEGAHHFLSLHLDCSGRKLNVHHLLLAVPA